MQTWQSYTILKVPTEESHTKKTKCTRHFLATLILKRGMKTRHSRILSAVIVIAETMVALSSNEA